MGPLARFLRRGPLPSLVLLGLLAIAPGAHAATHPCSTGLPPVVDIPFGSVAFSTSTTGPVGAPLTQQVQIYCDTSVFSGNKTPPMAILADMATGTSYDAGTRTWLVPTGDPNLSVQIQENSAPAAPSGSNPYVLANLQGPGPSTWTASFTLQLVKRYGPVNPANVPATLVQISNTNDGKTEPVVIGTFRIGGGTTIRSLSCVASSVTVQLPTVTSQSLAVQGAVAGTTPVPLQISGCPAGTQLSIALSGAAAMLNGLSQAAAGIVQPGGTAGNVGIQLLHDAAGTNPVDISGSRKTYLGTVSGSGDLSVSFYARYYALGQATSGRVTAGLTYTLSYP